MKSGASQIFRHFAAYAAFLAILMFFFAFSPCVARADGPDDLLAKVESNVEKFADDIAYMRYEEDIQQQKLKDNDKVAYQQEMVFDSIVRTRYEEGKLRVDEQRILEKTPRHVEARPLLNTYGFSTLALVFHPYYESSFRYTRLEDDTLQGMILARIHFEHIPGKPTPVLYQIIGADKPLELTGTAWVDPASGDIHRIEAAFTVEVNDFGLKSIRAAVSYAPVMLQDDTTPRLLPAEATIDLETPRQHWRNIHHFVDYRKYRVSVNMPGASTQ